MHRVRTNRLLSLYHAHCDIAYQVRIFGSGTNGHAKLHRGQGAFPGRTTNKQDEDLTLIPEINTLRSRILDEIAAANTAEDVNDIRINLLGRKGELAGLFGRLRDATIEDRRTLGAAVNNLKTQVTEALEDRTRQLRERERDLSMLLDPTLPGIAPVTAGLHPIRQMIHDLNDAFVSMNFEVYEGPQISSEEAEFDHMNFPPDHPARESMDTYWLEGAEGARGADRLCLRPHLTGASARYMQTNEPPFRFVYPGRVYRNESTDARHERAFFQYEALILDRDIPFSTGQLLIQTILQTVFGRPVKTRMRAGFFPFVEPGFEIDMQCQICGGRGCRVCKNVGWIEIMPGGVPHPNVLLAAGIDPANWMGFYINVGLDRLAMMRYGIEDVRRFHGADLRFLEQFR